MWRVHSITTNNGYWWGCRCVHLHRYYILDPIYNALAHIIILETLGIGAVRKVVEWQCHDTHVTNRERPAIRTHTHTPGKHKGLQCILIVYSSLNTPCNLCESSVTVQYTNDNFNPYCWIFLRAKFSCELSSKHVYIQRGNKASMRTHGVVSHINRCSERKISLQRTVTTPT